jgi:hypothetical protein
MSAIEFYEKEFAFNNEAYKTLIRLQGKTSPKAVDPGTVIAAIETGKKIYDLFNKKKGKKDEMIAYMKKEFAAIKKLLGQVLNELEELKVLVNSQIRDFTVNNLDSVIKIFNESYDTWWKYSNRDDIKREVAETYSKLKEYVRVAEQYGYAHFNTIWVAVMYEYTILDYYGRPKTERVEILKGHQQYFQEALNPGIAGSIVNSLNATAGQIVTLNNNYPALQHTNVWSRQVGINYITYNQTLTISGSVLTGFAINLGEVIEVGRQRDTDTRPGCVRCKEESEQLKALLNFKAKNIDFNATINNYNSALRMYSTVLLPSLNELRAGKQGLETYVACLSALMKN